MTERRRWMTLLAAGSALCVGACGATASPPAPPASPPPQAAISAASPATETAAASAPAAVAQNAPQGEDINERLDALEKQVSDLRNDMSLMMPALTKLVNAQQDLQQVLNRMEAAAGGAAVADKTAAASPEPAVAPSVPVDDGTAAPQSLMPAIGNPQALEDSLESSAAAPLPHDDVPPPTLAEGLVAPAAEAMRHDTAESVAAIEPASGSSDTDVTMTDTGAQPASSGSTTPAADYTVSQLRYGEHANMTRLVLDASGKVPYSYELDQAGTGLTIRLPKTAWNAAAQPDGPSRSPVIDSYTTSADGQDGTVLTVKLKKPVSVSWADVLPPSGDGGNRVVIDLAPRP